jgi:hypothetical protein
MLETRKHLCMEKKTLEPNAGFSRIKAGMAYLTGDVRDYAREQAGS